MVRHVFQSCRSVDMGNSAWARHSRGGRSAATLPAAPAKTGEFDLVFTQRSPLSTRKELAHRLNLKEAEMATTTTSRNARSKSNVPANYAPSVPCGVFVYLNYKEHRWHPHALAAGA